MTNQRTVAGPVLMAATVGTGLMAGLFFAFDVAVMPGLNRGDDRAFAEAMRAVNQAIQNGVFGLVFCGALPAAAAAAVLQHRLGRRSAARWAAASAVLYAVALAVTFGVNIPLNDELARLGDHASAAQLADIHHRFTGTWQLANAARTLSCTAALGCLGRALVLHGRGCPRPPAGERVRAVRSRAL
ncbi:DUF1772 domain-containing protein [Streptomyces sp. NPDC052396]|uniref:DUF1772 domain-containing protein n=1 Tax=Streptomyces sp. NPDC052396 TaxID=3365689 RepID=UPI0037D059F8